MTSHRTRIPDFDRRHETVQAVIYQGPRSSPTSKELVSEWTVQFLVLQTLYSHRRAFSNKLTVICPQSPMYISEIIFDDFLKTFLRFISLMSTVLQLSIEQVLASLRCKLAKPSRLIVSKEHLST